MITVATDGVLFDLDGVLVDSQEDVVAHWRQFAEWFDLDGDELVTRIHGRRHSDTIRRELAYLTESELVNVIHRYEDLECTDVAGTREVSGARLLMQSLPDARWAVVTSCVARLVEARLGAVDLPLPKLLISAEQVTHGKPHPEGYLAGAALLGVDAKRCVVFEDALSGLQAALAAGAMPVGVATTFSADELRSVLPEGGVVIKDLSCVSVGIGTDDFALELALDPL